MLLELISKDEETFSDSLLSCRLLDNNSPLDAFRNLIKHSIVL